MLELEQALDRILAALPVLPPEIVALPEADGRVLAEPLVAASDLPAFDNSAVDGYAVRAADLCPASAAAPVRLEVAAKIPAGKDFPASVLGGQCVRLFTGSPLPKGADAIVMQEDTRPDPGSPAHVLVGAAVLPGENVRARGGDIRAGTTLLEPGVRLNPAHVALAAALGRDRLRVGPRPRVALLATGSELVEAGGPLRPGQIHESNRAALAALAQAAGALPKTGPIVPDEPAATRHSLEAAFAECDIVISSGGVSVGEMDFVKSAFEQIGGTLEFWRVSMKPGRPFVFGRRGDRFLFGLPGNPVSGFVTFLSLVRPSLLRWQGASRVGLPVQTGLLAEPVRNDARRRHFLRVRVSADGFVRTAGLQASHALGSMAAANGLLDLPPEASFGAGEVVRVLRWTMD